MHPEPQPSKYHHNSSTHNIQTLLKTRIFSIPQYNQSIRLIFQQLQSLPQQQKSLILHGQYKHLYNSLLLCQTKNVYNSSKIDCIKQKLHQECKQEFMSVLECMKNNKGKHNQCEIELGQYFLCSDNKMRNLYWSGEWVG